jgi:hypothetical protein
VTVVSNFLYDYFVRKKLETLELESTSYIAPQGRFCFQKFIRRHVDIRGNKELKL